jgi:hypothetical protein
LCAGIHDVAILLFCIEQHPVAQEKKNIQSFQQVVVKYHFLIADGESFERYTS